jgi:hypothetical protein
MIVVADTSPLNYLVLIDEIDLLPAIFGQVLLPQAVFQELGHPKTSPTVRQWVYPMCIFPNSGWTQIRSQPSSASRADGNFFRNEAACLWSLLPPILVLATVLHL